MKIHHILLSICSCLMISLQAATYHAPDNTAIQANLGQAIYGKIATNKFNTSINVTLPDIKEILQAQSNVKNNLQNIRINNYTIYHWVAEKGDVDLFRILDKMDDHNKNAWTKKDNYGWAPLHYAAFYNHALVVGELLKLKDIVPNAKTKKGSATPLHLAAAQKAEATIKVFAQYRAKILRINEKDKQEKTAKNYYEDAQGKDEDVLAFLSKNRIKTRNSKEEDNIHTPDVETDNELDIKEEIKNEKIDPSCSSIPNWLLLVGVPLAIALFISVLMKAFIQKKVHTTWRV